MQKWVPSYTLSNRKVKTDKFYINSNTDTQGVIILKDLLEYESLLKHGVGD